MVDVVEVVARLETNQRSWKLLGIYTVFCTHLLRPT